MNLNKILLETISEYINENNNRKKYNNINDINPNKLIGLTLNDIPEFSDKLGFEYYHDKNDYIGNIINLGGNLFYLDDNRKYNIIPNIIFDNKTKTYEYNKDIPDRIKKYGNTMPKAGNINAIHGSPHGKIEKFDDNMFGKGYQQEELEHERFAGVYLSDDTNENKLLNRGYGEVHTYNISFNNSINEIDAEKLLENYEKQINKKLNRNNASKYITSLGYDIIYRKFNDNDNFEYIALNTNNIKLIN